MRLQHAAPALFTVAWGLGRLFFAGSPGLSPREALAAVAWDAGAPSVGAGLAAGSVWLFGATELGARALGIVLQSLSFGALAWGRPLTALLLLGTPGLSLEAAEVGELPALTALWAIGLVALRGPWVWALLPVSLGMLQLGLAGGLGLWDPSVEGLTSAFDRGVVLWLGALPRVGPLGLVTFVAALAGAPGRWLMVVWLSVLTLAAGLGEVSPALFAPAWVTLAWSAQAAGPKTRRLAGLGALSGLGFGLWALSQQREDDGVGLFGDERRVGPNLGGSISAWGVEPALCARWQHAALSRFYGGVDAYSLTPGAPLAWTGPLPEEALVVTPAGEAPGVDVETRLASGEVVLRRGDRVLGSVTVRHARGLSW
ncbi:MAG: hypothetical protein IPN01_10545 [Deltaproteobacteria bacterium]|nr:hypothetical protein [Deltaproteobacteria bacterium]